MDADLFVPKYKCINLHLNQVLAISLETEHRAVAISCFLNDREIEFYCESFPECCVRHHEGEDSTLRNMMAAVALWAPKWTLAEVR